MAGEYLLTTTVNAGEVRSIPIPAVGIAGIYATAAITLKWDFNGNVAELMNAAVWEPYGGFHPAATSAIILDNTAGGSAVDVAIRVSAA